METVYFAEDYQNYRSDADIVLFYLSPENVSGARIFHTLRIDLTKPEEEIFSEFDSTTRHQIHQIEKKHDFELRYYDTPDLKILDEFFEYYDEFVREKGIVAGDKNLLLMAQEQNALSISLLADKDGQILCGLASIHEDSIVLMMYGFSYFRKFADSSMRNIISKANRYLHWEMIRHYKKLGYKTLDMGGLGMGQETSDLNTVDRFKMGFGGKIHTLQHFYHARTMKGKIVLMIMQKNKKIAY